MKYSFSIVIVLILTVFNLGYSQTTCSPGGLIFVDDLNLQAALVESLGEIEGYTCEGLASLETLRLVQKGIKSLEGLQHATNLSNLVLASNEVSDLTPITSLKKLRALNVSKNQIFTIPDLTQMTALKSVNFSGNSIEDISPLLDANLTAVNVSDNPIAYQNLSLIASLHNVSNLGVAGLGLSNLSQVFALLYDHGAVTHLDISRNDIRDLSLLSNFTSLRIFSASNNKISNIDSLAGMVTLERLNLSGNFIKDITPVARLNKLSFLILNSNNIESIEAVYNLENLVQLQLRDNYISSLHEFVANSNFGSLPKSLLRVEFNCLTNYDASALQALQDSDNVRVLFGKQRRLDERRPDPGCTATELDGPSLFTIEINPSN